MDNIQYNTAQPKPEREISMRKVSLKKRGAHTLERNENGKWILDGKEIDQESAISELMDAVDDLGYWCQVAKDVLPEEEFELVQESYLYDPESEVETAPKEDKTNE